MLLARSYQVRGFDLANITFVRGDTGWIVFDPLTMTEKAAAALALVTLDQAIGKGVANGTAGLIAPSVHIADDMEELTVDGVRTVPAMSTGLLLDFLGIRWDSRKAIDHGWPVNVSHSSRRGDS